MTKTLAAALLGLALLGLSPGAGAFLGFGGTSWKEEVLLHDGGTITVERHMDRHGRHEPGRSSPIGSQSIEVTVPGTSQKLIWRDDYSDDVGSANFNPIALHILNGVPYIVATTYGCLSYNKWGRPNPPYVIFRNDGKQWQRAPMSELPVEFKTINLVIAPSNEEKTLDQLGTVPAAQIVKMNRRLVGSQYKTILREAYKGASGDCTRMIRIKSGWEGLGFFRSRGSRGACLKYCQDQAVAQQDCPCNELFEQQ